MENLKFAQDLIKTSNSSFITGFNKFILGYTEPNYQDYGDKDKWYAESQGYQCSENMAKDKGIAFTHNFNCECGGKVSIYGGRFLCDSCGRVGIDKDWWKIKVEKDGNEYCCHGLDFVNLQESNNYAFGNTFQLAIDNYYKVMKCK